MDTWITTTSTSDTYPIINYYRNTEISEENNKFSIDPYFKFHDDFNTAYTEFFEFPEDDLTTIIAGGFCRDYTLGKHIKDCDIFLKLKEGTEISTVCSFIEGYFEEYEEHKLISIEEISEDYSEPRPFFGFSLFRENTSKKVQAPFYVLEVHLEKMLPIQFIITENQNLVKLVEEFPCNLSKIYREPYLDEMIQTNEFEFGIKNNIISFTENCPQEYENRLCSKYSSFCYGSIKK